MYGLIGKTLAHSHSVAVHTFFNRYAYSLVELDENALADFVRGGEWEGLNVTIPYKRAVMPLCDRLSEAAARIGSVNTLTRLPDGGVYGDNTDYAGFSALARRAGVRFAGAKVLILGTGGTARTAKCVATDEGARETLMATRNPGAANTVGYDDITRYADAEIVVNATPVGMYPRADASPIDLRMFPRLTGALDAIYNPLRTRFTQAAQDAGARASGGLYMLVAQGAAACERFTGKPLPEGETDRAHACLAKQLTNVVLAGMPGCGKTCVGRAVAGMLGREFWDTDEEIEREAGMTVPEIFAREGEDGFRARETRTLAKICDTGGRVIAVGGGAVLRGENRAYMRQNGFVAYIRRPLESLDRSGRPLSASADALRAMYEVRKNLYEAVSDCAADNERAPEDAARAIVKAFEEAKI